MGSYDAPMPEARWLLKVTSAQIKKLEADADVIDDISDKAHYLTYYPLTISYFTTGKVQLCPALAGDTMLDCSTVVDGELGIVRPTTIAKQLAWLEALDLGAIERAVDAAKPKPLVKQGVDDFDMLVEPRGQQVVSEIVGLIAFYRRIAKAKSGVAMYTS